jgi:hypothetical protein
MHIHGLLRAIPCVVLLPHLLALPAATSEQQAAIGSGYSISGRVLDPHGLRPEAGVLMLGVPSDESFSSSRVPVAADGSFVTRLVPPGSYVLQLVRTPHSPTKPATTVGLTVVSVVGADVTGVSVTIQRDVAVDGKFTMRADDPRAAWPPHIVVNAFLALDGEYLLGGTVADGAPAGRFVLRNAFGPRVIRPGYTLAAGSRWWPDRVLLDGVDVTNVPTDFSAHPSATIEVVFTQHPAWIGGVVQGLDGRPVRGAWVLVASADARLRQSWATTTIAAQTGHDGSFQEPCLPGSYVAQAFMPREFQSLSHAQRSLHRLTDAAVRVDVAPRQTASAVLKVSTR